MHGCSFVFSIDVQINILDLPDPYRDVAATSQNHFLKDCSDGEGDRL